MVGVTGFLALHVYHWFNPRAIIYPVCEYVLQQSGSYWPLPNFGLTLAAVNQKWAYYLVHFCFKIKFQVTISKSSSLIWLSESCR